MGFTRLEFQKSWLSSKDFPTYEDSEQKVREDMQYHPDAIRDFLNQFLLVELEGENGASWIGDRGGGTLKGTLEQLQKELEDCGEDILNLAVGDPPEAVRTARVEFAAEDWVEETGIFVLRLPQALHKRKNPGFGLRIWETVGQEERDTWNAVCTGVRFEDATGDMVLTAGTGYTGGAVFFGV